jgi:hypothetical protein
VFVKTMSTAHQQYLKILWISFFVENGEETRKIENRKCTVLYLKTWNIISFYCYALFDIMNLK